MQRRRMLASVAVLALLGCGGPGFCSLPSLNGVWQIAFRQTNGNCGDLRPQTVDGGSGTGNFAGVGNCVFSLDSTSANKCHRDYAYSCTSLSLTIPGTIYVTGASDQVSATEVTSSETVSSISWGGQCTSTYTVTATRL